MDFHFNNWNPSHQLDNLGFQNENNSAQVHLGTDNSFLFTRNPTIGHQPSSQMPYAMGPPTLPLGQGQPGLLTQTVTELRRTIVSSQGVQVQRVIDYSPIRRQPISSLPWNQAMHVTEMVRTTRLLTPAFTMDRLLGACPSSWNSSLCREGVSSFNQPMDNLSDFGESSFHDGFTYGNNLRQNWPSLNAGDFINDPSEGQTQVALRNMNLGLKGTASPSPNLCNNEVASSGHIDENSDNDDMKYDGRTHSLPTKKHGPYICPKCRVVFSTSQCFAAHANSHYKFETKEERKRRLAAKHKKRSLLANGWVAAATKSGKAVAKSLLRARNIALDKGDSRMKDLVKQQDAGVAGPKNSGAVVFTRIKEEPV